MGNVIEPIKEGLQALENGMSPFKGLKGLLWGLTLLLSLCTEARHYEVDGIEWNYRIGGSKRAEIKAVSKTTPAIDKETRGFVTVPSKISNYTVSRIGHNAFSNCRRITGIAIPRSVIYIGTNAFYKCRSLKEVTIGGRIKEIMAGTFDGCGSLERISFANSVKKIGARAFDNCKSLVDIGMLDNVESIGENAFRYCNSLTDVILPEGLESLGKCAFFGCESLASVSIPDSATDIALDAFYLCNSLVSLEVGEGNPVYSSRNNILCNKDGPQRLAVQQKRHGSCVLSRRPERGYNSGWGGWNFVKGVWIQ